MTAPPVLETQLGDLPVVRGKVRDVYDLGENLLIVSTDRISAFDWVLPTGIADKGRILTEMSRFWFDYLAVPNHLITTRLAEISLPVALDPSVFEGRVMLVRKAEVVPVECVVRGYLTGSGWREYEKTGAVCGLVLPEDLRESDQLLEPIFTPATKAAQGQHDENISFNEMATRIGRELAEEMRRRSLDIYRSGAELARRQGILIADTKFEFGLVGDELLLIDEVLTPDSSRFWPADQYEPGRSQPSFDKQFVRNWLIQSGWDRNSPPPELPEEIVAQTRAKYIDAFERLTGRDLFNPPAAPPQET